MRVIAGKYRSRPLQSLRGFDLRPTADRLRETLFDVLTSGNPSALEATVWLDLFAGTGAVGIEALSRSAAIAYFVESSARAAQMIVKNLGSLGISQGFQIIRQDALRGISHLEAQAVQLDFVFLDPPYKDKQAYSDVLNKLAGSPMLKPSTIVVAEHHKKTDLGESFASLKRYRVLTQGDAALSFFRPKAT